MAEKMDPQVRALYARIYDRNDLVRTRQLGSRLALLVATVWLLCGAFNYLGPGRRIGNQRDRAVFAFAYGPAFGPLHLARGQRTIAVFGRRAPARMGAVVVGGSALGLCLLLAFGGGEERAVRVRQRRRAQRYAADYQGRPLPKTVARKLALTGPGMPLAVVEGKLIGVPYGKDRGHVGVFAPSRSGKGLHLTEALLTWPGPAIVLDPKSEQWDRTAGYRQQHVGPVYRIPPLGIDILDYFKPDASFDVQELHTNLLRTWQDREPIFAEKSLSLFQAAMEVGAATGQHPLRLLAKWAEMPAPAALLEARRHARAKVDQFTDGEDLTEGLNNRFAQSAWGTFTTRFAPLIPHIDTVTTPTIRPDWFQQPTTIYLTYPLDQIKPAGPLIGTIFAAMIKLQLRQPQKTYTLFALDELPAIALAHLETYIATVGGSGAMMLMYLQSITQLDSVYGQANAKTILENCNTKLLYRPNGPETAAYITQMFGDELQFSRSESRSSSIGNGPSYGRRQTSASYQESYRPALPLSQPGALPITAVVVLAQDDRHAYRVLGERLNPIPELATLPPPPRMRPWRAAGNTAADVRAAATAAWVEHATGGGPVPAQVEGSPGEAGAVRPPEPERESVDDAAPLPVDDGAPAGAPSDGPDDYF
jgi:hypothetical protein